MNVILIIKYYSTVMQGRESCVSATPDFSFTILKEKLVELYVFLNSLIIMWL